MNSSNYDFRKFQEELAALDAKSPKKAAVSAASKKPSAADRMASAKGEFLALRERHGLTVADVVSFFPEEEGIAYLQQLTAASQAKPRRKRKSNAQD